MLSRREIERAHLRPRYFIPHLKIMDGDGGPPIPFEPWDFQDQVLTDIEESARVIFLKARQLGLSWLTLAYILWATSSQQGINAMILNRGLEQSVDLLDRIRFMIRHCPPELRPRVGKDNYNQLEFPDLDSKIWSIPATEFAGTGSTIHIFMIDEWAKIRGVGKMLTSILPTVPDSGKLIGISTAYGPNNPYAVEWKRAVSKQSKFRPVFIPWDAHPRRDDTWYEDKRMEFPTERELLQEYPSEWRDAFQLPGESVFRDEFDRAKHVVSFKRDPKARWAKVRGIDFGYHHGVHLWAEIQQDTCYVFAEHHAERRTTARMMEEVVERDKEMGIVTTEAPAGCDPAGKAQTSMATESDHYTVERFGIRVGSEEVAPRDRVTLIKDMLKRGNLYFDASCEYLIEAMEQAQWAKGAPPMGSASSEPILKETYEKDGYFEHPLDTLGYLLINVFPVFGLAQGAKTKKPAPSAKRNPYSRSEFG